MPKGQYDRSAIVEKRQRDIDIKLGKIKPPSEVLIARSANETDEQIDARIKERFRVMSLLTDTVISGTSKALIVAGPPGLGKSFNTEKKLEQYSPTGGEYNSIRGFVRTTGLYKALYSKRDHGQITVFDDADSVFDDINSLNLLKAACDTTERRVISYLAETSMIDDDTGEAMPPNFEFHGSVIFITNLDFDDKITSGDRLAPHMQAMMSRAHYINLGMNSTRDYMIRVKQVVYHEGLFNGKGLDEDAIDDVIQYMDINRDKLREVSLRQALKIGEHRKNHPNDWIYMSDITTIVPTKLSGPTVLPERPKKIVQEKIATPIIRQGRKPRATKQAA